MSCANCNQPFKHGEPYVIDVAGDTYAHVSCPLTQEEIEYYNGTCIGIGSWAALMKAQDWAKFRDLAERLEDQEVQQVIDILEPIVEPLLAVIQVAGMREGHRFN